jgi:DNA repair ATPase RecN
MDDDVTQRIKDLRDLMARYEEAKNLQFTAEELANDMRKNFAYLEKGLKDLPPKIKILKLTLEEMMKNSGPGQYADYHDEKSQIRKNQDNLESCEQDLLQIGKDFEQRKIDSELINNNIKKSTTDINKMRQEVEKLDKCSDALNNLVASFDDTTQTVDDVQDQMHDCMIPINIDKRDAELNNFSKDLKTIKDDFIDLVKQDETYSGDLTSENEIKRQITDIKDAIKTFEKDEKSMYVELEVLQEWTEEECMIIEEQRERIKRVQAFKDRLDERIKALALEHDNIRRLQEELSK